MELKEAVRALPKQPGVYLMKNSLGVIVYVGKAKNLKARVAQYFHKNEKHSPKVREMVEHIHSFDYITVDTELDAFLLECRKIKELQPRYNRLLKNSKGYQYIKLSVNEDYPRFSVMTRQGKDKSMYFGPFTSKGCVENTIQFIRDYYPVSKCKGALKMNSSGCLNFHLGNCPAPCRGVDIREEYRLQIQRVIELLQGKDNTPLKYLQNRMMEAAESLDFEKAVFYREQLRGIRHILGKQRVIKVSRYGRNIMAAEKYGDACLKVFLIKGNRLLHEEVVETTGCDEIGLEEKFREMLTYFKKQKTAGTLQLNQDDIDEAQIIYSYLKNKNNGVLSINIPESRLESFDFSENPRARQFVERCLETKFSKE